MPLIRSFIASFLMFSLLMTNFYAATLRAHLMKPDMSVPIETLPDLFASGLPWSMSEYGFLQQAFSGMPEDSPEVKLWRGNQATRNSGFNLERVAKAKVCKFASQRFLK